MRKMMMVFAISILCAFAQGAWAGEPFGAEPHGASYQLAAIEERLAHELQPVVLAIAQEVRRHDRKQWIAKTNELVNRDLRLGECAEQAMVKRAVLMMLGFFPEQIRIVGGEVRLQGGVVQYHAVLALYLEGEWVVLDNGTLAQRARYMTVRPEDLRGFKALYSYILPPVCRQCRDA